MRTANIGRWQFVAATLMVGGAIAGSIVNAQEVQCPCFDANELKQEARFIEESAAIEGVLPERRLELNKSFAENMYEGGFSIETLAPDDTFVQAILWEDTYPTPSYWLCFHNFYYLDQPQHPNVSVNHITEEESAACAVEMAKAFAKDIKDEE